MNQYIIMTEEMYKSIIEKLRSSRKLNSLLLLGIAGVWIYKKFNKIRELEEENENLKLENEILKGDQ